MTVLPLLNLSTVLVVLSAAAITDRETRRIPNSLTYSGLILALLASLVPSIFGVGETGSCEHISCAALGIAVCFGVMFVMWMAGATGGGDVKLAAVIGGFLGWQLGLTAILWAHLVAATWAIYQACRTHGVRCTAHAIMGFLAPFFPLVHRMEGPTSCAESSLVLTTRMPMGTSFLLGTLIAVWGGSLL